MNPEEHLLYVLLDSNLPTGGFVASSGLESWAKHGFVLFDPDSPSTSTPSSSVQTRGKRPAAGQNGAAVGVTEFAKAEVENYARTTAGFVRDAWGLVDRFVRGDERQRGGEGAGAGGRQTESSAKRKRKSVVEEDLDLDMDMDHEMDIETDQTDKAHTELDTVLSDLTRLDTYHEACMLSHVSRRASKAQGVAMLTLYTKGLCAPTPISSSSQGGKVDPVTNGHGDGGRHGSDESPLRRQRMDTRARGLIDAYKLAIRRGSAPGHLAVCFGAITAALGISVERALHLHLFLHARSLLSASVRLNLIGPYLSSQLLLHPFRHIIANTLERETLLYDKEGEKIIQRGSAPFSSGRGQAHGQGQGQGQGKVPNDSSQVNDIFLYPDLADPDPDPDLWDWVGEAERGPATTWPLGEILVGRHDLQHSRIFNS